MNSSRPNERLVRLIFPDQASLDSFAGRVYKTNFELNKPNFSITSFFSQADINYCKEKYGVKIEEVKDK